MDLLDYMGYGCEVQARSLDLVLIEIIKHLNRGKAPAA